MPNERANRIRRIKLIEVEYLATRFSMSRLLADMTRDSTILQPVSPVKPRDVRGAALRLESTFIVRVFAEFETSLRFHWSSTRPTDPPYRTQDLINGVAARNRIAERTKENAHIVRCYRNNLLHLDSDPVQESLDITDTRQYLCQFLSFLPRDW